jgi:uncharacterized protein (DUF488 family)
MPTQLFTIGHSNHPLEQFLALLAQHRLEALVDIRRFPGSRKHPHFNREGLDATLKHGGVQYHWFEALGGRRKKIEEASINVGLRNDSFRNFADYMATEEFRAAVVELVRLAEAQRAAIMCSEGLFWQCHRRLVSDFLTANGVTVQHIMPNGKIQPHALTSGAKVEDGKVTYPGDATLFEAP